MIVHGEIVKIFKKTPNWGSVVIKTDSEKVKAAGTMIGNILEGTIVDFEGEFYVHPVYGRQFDVKDCKVYENLTPQGIRQFLITFLDGIGEKTADLIIAQFGKDTLNVIENDYTKLVEVKGISEKKAIKIHTSYALNKAYVDIVEFFKGDITENQASKIYNKYKENSLKILKEDPYQLIYDIDGMGFKKVDKLALASGVSPDSRKRVGAAIIFTLKTLSDNGDVYVSDEELAIKVKECLDKEKLDVQVTINNLADEIMEQVKEEKLVIEDGKDGVKIYLKYLNEAENEVAEMVKNLVSATPEKRDFLPEILASEKKNNIEFDDIQRAACNMALNNLCSVITGGPGMGKTTIIKTVIDVYGSDKVICLAPTGKATKRMQESTGHLASTIDAFLLQNEHSAGARVYENYMFIVDESSMVDIVKARRLLRFITKELGRILLVGDIFQLPSIGPGNFLRDLISCKLVPTTKLKFSYRFGGTIAKNAKAINEGMKFSDLDFSDHNSMEFIKAGGIISKETVENEFKKALQKYSIEDIMVIVPKRVKSNTATGILNVSLRDIHNPVKNPRSKDFDFAVGDRVMNTQNDYQIEGTDFNTGKPVLAIYNGDTGTVKAVYPSLKKVEVLFDDGRLFEFNTHTINRLVPAYAITCHKSQGSEAKCVITVLNNEHYTMLNRNLLYTAITRGKEKVTLIGEPWAINEAIKNTIALTRNTQLAKKIENAI